MHDPRSIANFIIDTRRFLGVPTTALELQKLLYFCYALYLKQTGHSLVAGSFEAWEYGPVHPLVYRSFKAFGDRPITSRAKAKNAVTGTEMAVARPDKQVQRHVVKVVSSLLDFNAGQLVDLSHAPNGPWDIVWRKKDSKGATISDRIIIEHYANIRLPLRTTEDNNAAFNYRDIPPYDD